jgi:hypothetical protein
MSKVSIKNKKINKKKKLMQMFYYKIYKQEFIENCQNNKMMINIFHYFNIK